MSTEEQIEHARKQLRYSIMDNFRRGSADEVVKAIERLIEAKLEAYTKT